MFVRDIVIRTFLCRTANILVFVYIGVSLVKVLIVLYKL